RERRTGGRPVANGKIAAARPGGILLPAISYAHLAGCPPERSVSIPESVHRLVSFDPTVAEAGEILRRPVDTGIGGVAGAVNGRIECQARIQAEVPLGRLCKRLAGPKSQQRFARS